MEERGNTASSNNNRGDKAGEKETRHRGNAPLTPDFSSFVLSLSTSALMNLGEIENPQTGKIEKDLAMARHTIDILAILQEKTRGNLTKDEQSLLDNILFELRMKYLRASKTI